MRHADGKYRFLQIGLRQVGWWTAPNLYERQVFGTKPSGSKTAAMVNCVKNGIAQFCCASASAVAISQRHPKTAFRVGASSSRFTGMTEATVIVARDINRIAGEALSEPID